MDEQTTVVPETESTEAPPVLLLPGHIFFVERVDLPASLESSEIDDFAELSLEGIAPFPIEQLAWGFIYSESSQSILLYAAYKERIKALGYSNLESYLWVLPDFATTFGADFPKTTVLELQSEEGISRITYAADDVLPKQIVSYTPDSEATPRTASASALSIQLTSIAVKDQGLVSFHFQQVELSDRDSVEEWKKLTPSENTLWRADVRDVAFKKSERNSRKMSAWISSATVYSIWFALLLIIMEGVLIGGDLWLQSQADTINAQAPEVSRIEDKLSLMNKLDQVAQNELRPIAILDALNQSRPEGIYFTETVTEGQNKIIIEGIANTINELNAYIETLRKSGKFSLIGDPRTVTRGGKTTFTVSLSYIHFEEPAPEVETDQVKEEETTEE